MINFPIAVKIVGREKRFASSIVTECEKRSKSLCEELNSCGSDIEAEYLLLHQVKFIGDVLKALRERNKNFEKEMGMKYAKLVGLGTPYEEAIHSMRKVKRELDVCLKTLRDHMVENMKRQFNIPKKYRGQIIKQKRKDHSQN